MLSVHLRNLCNHPRMGPYISVQACKHNECSLFLCRSSDRERTRDSLLRDQCKSQRRHREGVPHVSRRHSQKGELGNDWLGTPLILSLMLLSTNIAGKRAAISCHLSHIYTFTAADLSGILNAWFVAFGLFTFLFNTPFLIVAQSINESVWVFVWIIIQQNKAQSTHWITFKLQMPQSPINVSIPILQCRDKYK